MYCCKLDIHDYFNSVDVARFLPMLREALAEDPALYDFLSGLLLEPRVLEKGRERTEQKGIMAGTPQAAFYADLCLGDLDRGFYEAGIPYARYSDDIIFFSRTPEEQAARLAEIRALLDRSGLKINPDKEAYAAPGEPWTFLGFSFRQGRIDVAPVSVEKLKKKMRRKARALRRWQNRKGLSGDKAAVAFIRAFNRKLYENPNDHDLTWARWYFPVITTAESLAVLAHSAQTASAGSSAGPGPRPGSGSPTRRSRPWASAAWCMSTTPSGRPWRRKPPGLRRAPPADPAQKRPQKPQRVRRREAVETEAPGLRRAPPAAPAPKTPQKPQRVRKSDALRFFCPDPYPEVRNDGAKPAQAPPGAA